MHGAAFDGRQRELLADHGARIEVVVAGAFAESVQVHLPTRVAWKGESAAGLEERAIAQLEAGVGGCPAADPPSECADWGLVAVRIAAGAHA